MNKQGSSRAFRPFSNWRYNRGPKRFGGSRPNFHGKKKMGRGVFNPQDMVKAIQTEQVPLEEYVAKHAFLDFPFGDTIQENIKKKGYTTPSPIQDQTIPLVISGRDVVGLANTGTGKTAAFLLPLIRKAALDRNKKVLILTPTRELAQQIRDEFISFSRGLSLFAVLCIGGANRYGQKKELHRGYSFVIGTPGRVKDFVNSGDLPLAKFDTVVLDEADHMLDIGFIHDVKYLVSKLPPVRQSLFFSATVGTREQEVMNTLLREPITVSVKKRETIANIEQRTVKVPDVSQKLSKLSEILSEDGVDKVIVFGRTKHGVQKISNTLLARGFRVGAIHGNKSQGQRARTLAQFKRRDINILLATDVASRGLDIDDVSHVINYDLPATREDYIHRIGRTGRANKTGVAITFVE